MKKLLLFLSLLPFISYGQEEVCTGDDGLCVVQFNAAFNSANEVKWLEDLTDCSISTVDIMADPTLPTEYKIVVVPTILILEDGAEVARFQANIMMTMEASKDDVQEAVDEVLLSDF